MKYFDNPYHGQIVGYNIESIKTPKVPPSASNSQIEQSIRNEDLKIENFETYKRSVDVYGFAVSYKNVNIYNHYLACTLYSNNLVFMDLETKQYVDTELLQKKFRKVFGEGVKAGEEYFKNRYKEGFLTYKDKVFIDDIVEKYTKNGVNDNIGWNYVKKKVRHLTISLKQIYELGYYSVLVKIVDEIIDENPIWVKHYKEKMAETPPPAKPKETTFEQLFKDKDDVPTILEYVKEYVSDSGKWLNSPKVGCLVALCMVLEKREYLLNTWTNPQKAQAFSQKFGVQFTPKKFQESERGKSVYLMELFNLIPTKTQ